MRTQIPIGIWLCTFLMITYSAYGYKYLVFNFLDKDVDVELNISGKKLKGYMLKKSPKFFDSHSGLCLTDVSIDGKGIHPPSRQVKREVFLNNVNSI